MGHRSIKNTLIYIDLADFKNEEYIAKVATTVKEDLPPLKPLIEKVLRKIDEEQSNEDSYSKIL